MFSSSNEELATRFNVFNQTVSKWRNRDYVQDASCCPKNIEYAHTDLETALVISIRRSSWLLLDEVYETLLEQNTTISRISVYRCFIKNGISKAPQEQKDKTKKLKLISLTICILTLPICQNLMAKVPIYSLQLTELQERYIIKCMMTKQLNQRMISLINA